MDDAARLIAQTRAYARLSERDSAERDDLVQETLLRVWQRLVERGETDAASGLIRITLRRVRIDWWRKRQRSASLPRRSTREAPSPLDDAA